MWVIFYDAPLRHYNCKFRGALLIERLPLLILCHRVNICLLLSSVPFHRRGFDGSSRIQLHLVCFFPLWKTIVNYSVSHRNGSSIVFYLFRVATLSRFWKCSWLQSIVFPIPAEALYWGYLLFLQVGTITHKCASVKIRRKTSLYYRNQKVKSVYNSYPRRGHHVILPHRRANQVIFRKKNAA